MNLNLTTFGKATLCVKILTIMIHSAKHWDNTYNDFTYNDFTYNDFTYNDFTYNDFTYNNTIHITLNTSDIAYKINNCNIRTCFYLP